MFANYCSGIFKDDHFNRLVGNDDFFLHSREDVEVKSSEENDTTGSSRKRRDYQSINVNPSYQKNLLMRFNSSISNCWNGACGLLISRVRQNEIQIGPPNVIRIHILE